MGWMSFWLMPSSRSSRRGNMWKLLRIKAESRAKNSSRKRKEPEIFLSFLSEDLYFFLQIYLRLSLLCSDNYSSAKMVRTRNNRNGSGGGGSPSKESSSSFKPSTSGNKKGRKRQLTESSVSS